MLCLGRIAQEGQGRLERLPLGAVPCSPGVTTPGQQQGAPQGKSVAAMLRSLLLRSATSATSSSTVCFISLASQYGVLCLLCSISCFALGLSASRTRSCLATYVPDVGLFWAIVLAAELSLWRHAEKKAELMLPAQMCVLISSKSVHMSKH